MFRYSAAMSKHEDFVEEGTILAPSEAEAKKKLLDLRFDRVRVKRVHGLKGVFGRLTANIK